MTTLKGSDVPYGKAVSSVIAGAFMAYEFDYLTGVLFAGAWFAGWTMSIGEEVGAVGRFKKQWGEYIDWLGPVKGKLFGWKKGLQRGAFLGACLSLAMYSIPYGEIIIIACALFPAIYFLGNELYYKINKTDSWLYAEIIYGAVIGASLFLSKGV